MDIDILMLLIDVWILGNLFILIGVEGWVTLGVMNLLTYERKQIFCVFIRREKGFYTEFLCG